MSSLDRRKMLSKMQLLLFIFSVVLMCVSARPSVQGWDTVPEQWEKNKLDVLIDLVRPPMKVGTVTLVGWQFIHDEQGNVKEIRTLEVTFDSPNKEMDDRQDMFLLEPDRDLETDLPYIVDKMHEGRKMGLDCLGSAQSWDIEGNLEDMLLVDGHDIWKAGDDNDVYAMRNMTVKSLDDVKNWAEKYASAAILVSNPDGSFNEKESVVRPELQAYVTGNSDGTQEMVELALLALTNANLKHNNIDDILKCMTKTMTKELPEYTWILTHGHDGSYSNRDVHIGVSYTLTGLHEYPVEIELFGIKKD